VIRNPLLVGLDTKKHELENKGRNVINLAFVVFHSNSFMAHRAFLWLVQQIAAYKWSVTVVALNNTERYHPCRDVPWNVPAWVITLNYSECPSPEKNRLTTGFFHKQYSLYSFDPPKKGTVLLFLSFNQKIYLY
jgi:hypothetical protein